MRGGISGKRVCGLVAGALLVGGAATSAVGGASDSVAGGTQPGEPPNLGSAKDEVARYYGDGGDHRPSPDSQWAKDVDEQVGKAREHVESRLSEGVRNPAIVLDIDDTSELTYEVQAANDYGFDQEKFDRAVREKRFPAIEQTRDLTRWAHDRGVRIFFITGRDEPQQADTAEGLKQHGYPDPAGLFLDPTEQPRDYLPCGTDCTTVEYKAGTRAHLEQQGNTILANLGDQQSDLDGGHAERGYKLPNPMYFIPGDE